MSQDALSLLQSRPDVLRVIVDSVASTAASFTRQALNSAPPNFGVISEVPTLTSVGVIRFEGPNLALEILLGWRGEIMSAGDFSQESAPPDLPAEILNVAFGHIDPQLRGLGFVLKSSFPLTLSEKTIKALADPWKKPSASLSFDADGRQLWLMIFPGGTLSQQWRYTPQR